MISLRSYVEHLDAQNLPNFLELLKAKNLCRQDVVKPQELYDIEKRKYEKLYRQHKYEINEPNNWQKLLEKNFVYK
jgi:hypothetical protein